MSKSFYESVRYSTQESHVQEAYNNAFKLFFNIPVVERKHQCDGYFETKTSDNKEISVLIEYKYDIHMKDRVQRSKVVAQCLGYLKQFEQSGEKLPKLVFIGDINECCIIHTNDLLKLLDLDNVDWSVAPSSIGDKNIDLVFNIAKDISPWVYDVNEDFKFQDVADKITDLCNNVSRKLHITEKNIEKVYNLFCDRVLKDKKKVQANDLVSTFIGTMLDSEHYYQHPRKKNILIANDKQVAINGDEFELFMQMHSTEYSPKEKRIMTAISDRLIEDTNRRNKGEFYTPTLFVDYAHSMIEKELGSHWKENYVVWDCCYDDETEFMSDSGWKLIKDYKIGDKVLQFNEDRSAEFVEPLRYIDQAYKDQWVCLKGSQIDVRCTKDHHFVVTYDHKRHPGFMKIKAIDLYNKQLSVNNLHVNVPKSFYYNGDVHVDEFILRLAVAINADGTYCPNQTLTNNKNRTSRNTRFTENDTSVRDVYCVAIKKDRKIERLKWLLSEANINYKESHYNQGVQFTFHFPFNPKRFPVEWYHLDATSKAIFLDEIYYWDGSIGEHYINNKKYIGKRWYSAKLDDANLVSFLIASSNKGCRHSITHANSKVYSDISETAITDCKISPRNKNIVWSLEDPKEDDRCYCFEVPSGMLVVKRHGKIYVSSNCCGTKNLTRDYRFKELYCSTLEQAELDISRNYNKEATSFQFDFLNDSLDDLKVKAPGLLEVFELNKPIVFFLNPPYGTTSSFKGLATVGVSRTAISNHIKLKEFIAQFLYRIYLLQSRFNITNVKICIFHNPKWLCGQNYKNFRKIFFGQFEYLSGCLFRASEFANVSSQWGICFSIFNSCKLSDNSIFKHTLIESTQDYSIKEVGTKLLYNNDNHMFSVAKFVERNRKTNANVLAVLMCPGNDVQNNGSTFINSNCSYNAGGSHFITESNYEDCVSVLAARNLISTNWVIDKDEYMQPNENTPEYKQYIKDAIVYTIFGNQKSYRGENGSKNEFFWMSKQEMLDLAEEYNNDYTYEDALNSEERFVYLKLQEIKNDLSYEAKAVLDKATDLIKSSFKYRELFNESHPEYQINNWDCGFYQIKALLKEFMPDDLKEFRALYKQLADKMRPMIYELGFLK